jgi:hypothetical protein
MKLALILCCFNSKTAMYLEKTNLIISTIGIIIDILKLSAIPWGATSYAMEFLGVLTFIFLAINLVAVFFFFSLRLKKMVNDHNYRISFGTSCVMCFFSLLNFFFELLLMFIVLEDLYYYLGEINNETQEVLVSDGEWFIAFLTIVPSVMFWVVIFMLWISETLRVAVKTYGSFEDYIHDNTEVIIITRSINTKTNNNASKSKEIENKEKGVSIQEKDNSQVNIQTTYA